MFDAYYAFTYKLSPGCLYVHPLSTRLTHILSTGSLPLSDFLHKSLHKKGSIDPLNAGVAPI